MQKVYCHSDAATEEEESAEAALSFRGTRNLPNSCTNAQRLQY